MRPLAWRRRSSHEFKWLESRPDAAAGPPSQMWPGFERMILSLANSISAAAHFFCGIASVNDQPRMLYDEFVVVGGMIGSDQHAVLVGQILRGELATAHLGHAAVSHLRQLGDMSANAI